MCPKKSPFGINRLRLKSQSRVYSVPAVCIKTGSASISHPLAVVHNILTRCWILNSGMLSLSSCKCLYQLLSSGRSDSKIQTCPRGTQGLPISYEFAEQGTVVFLVCSALDIFQEVIFFFFFFFAWHFTRKLLSWFSAKRFVVTTYAFGFILFTGFKTFEHFHLNGCKLCKYR